MSRDVFFGIMSGMGQKYSKGLEEASKQEIEKRKNWMKFWEDRLKESERPEAQDVAAHKLATLHQTPYDKKLPKEVETVDDWLKIVPNASRSLLQAGGFAAPSPMPPLPPEISSRLLGEQPQEYVATPPPETVGPRYTFPEKLAMGEQEQIAQGRGQALGTVAGWQPRSEALRGMMPGLTEKELFTGTTGISLPREPTPPRPTLTRVAGTINGEPAFAAYDPVDNRFLEVGTNRDISAIFTPTDTSPDSKLGQTLIEDPDNPKLGLKANFDPISGLTYHPATGAVIPNPRPFHGDSSMIGSFFREVDEYGNITSYFNPKSGAKVESPGGRAAAVTGAEQKERSLLETMYEDTLTLETIARRNPTAIGPISGRVQALKRGTIGTSPDVNEMFRIADNLSDQLLRARSGAQINEAEYSRLSSLVPNPRGPKVKFDSDLRGFRSELKRTFEKRTGKPIGSMGVGGPTPPTAVTGEKRVRDPKSGRVAVYGADNKFLRWEK